MKYPVLFLLLSIVSCGKYDSAATRNSIGEIRRAESLVVSTTDRNNLSAICGALASKASNLGSVVGQSYTFSTRQTDCEGQVLIDGDISVLLQSSSGSFIFKKSDGLDYIFPEVEIHTQGLMAGVCADLVNFVNPIVDDGNSATWVTTSGISSRDCTPRSGEVCVLVERGTLTANQSYTIHTKDWMRIRTDGSLGNLGFFTQRKKLTQVFCPTNKSQLSEALLK